VTDPVFSLNGGNGEPDRLGANDDFAGSQNRPADFAADLVSLGFITAALRRSAWFLAIVTIVGLVVGAGIYKERPHQYQAEASVLLTLSPYEDSLTAPVDNQAIAETRAVAGLAVQVGGLSQTVSSLLSSYTATSVTDRLLTITASGLSADQAMLRASAVASAFLKFRASELQDEQNLVLQSLDQQVSLAKQRVSSIGAQISKLSSELTSPKQQSQLSRLRAELTSATNTMYADENAVVGNQTTTLSALTAALKTSQVLSVVSVPHSRLKPLLIYAAVGLLVALALGLGIVIVRAVVSDRLRRRDDIAYTLDAPVKLSIRTLRGGRWLTIWPGRAAKRDLDMTRVIAHLRSAVPRTMHGPAGLAVVAVDNAPVVARAVAALAASYAGQGHQVITADLSSGTHLARLLGVRRPGAHVVRPKSADFVVAVPDREDATPVGPLLAPAFSTGNRPPGDTHLASYAAADLLLSLVTLDPALGGDHLATWATNAVVVVTAGESPALRIHGVGEMIRLAGTRLDSVVLIGADKSDESLGLMRRPDEQMSIGVLGR
jgi:capsular polysaccharide biosynthesis protein